MPERDEEKTNEEKIKKLKNNFLLLERIWESIYDKKMDLYDFKINNFKPFKRHYFRIVYDEGRVPDNLSKNYSEIIGIDKRYLSGEKAFDPGIEIDGKTYHDVCDEYWRYDEEIKRIDEEIESNRKIDKNYKENLENKRNEFEELKTQAKSRLREFARKLVTKLESGSNDIDEDLVKLILFIKKDKTGIKHLIVNLQKLKLEKMLEADIELLEEYKKNLVLQYNLVNAAIILLKTDKEELKNCIKALCAEK